MNSKAYGKLNYTLALLSAASEGKFHGCIINSFHQVTSSFPPKFTITVNKDNETSRAVESAGSFCVTLLASDCPGSLIDLFGYKSGRAVDKFAGMEVKTDEAGNPYLTEHMASRISCKVVDRLEIGNFVLLVGEATEAEILTSGSTVLTLQEYTNRGKATPSRPPCTVRWRARDSAAPYAAISTRARRCRRTSSAPSAMPQRINS